MSVPSNNPSTSDGRSNALRSGTDTLIEDLRTDVAKICKLALFVIKVAVKAGHTAFQLFF